MESPLSWRHPSPATGAFADRRAISGELKRTRDLAGQVAHPSHAVLCNGRRRYADAPAAAILDGRRAGERPRFDSAVPPFFVCCLRGSAPRARKGARAFSPPAAGYPRSSVASLLADPREEARPLRGG